MKIMVVYYSMYGHVLKLARAAAAGAQTVEGAEVVLRRVQELESNLPKLQASKHAQEVLARQQDIPIATMDDLRAADGVIFGTPTVAGGRNDLEPAPEDLEIAKALGARVAQVAQKLRA